MNYKNKSFMTKKKAFTLIELLIVIAIIGILFIVLVSKVDFATDKAKATGVQTDFRSFQLAFEQVAKENSGFNTFGWDTGDTNSDRVRNSYDVGDTNKDGVQDSGETWTGRKVYTETWTGVYTLVKPGTTNYDADVIASLESAINANLDPKLHITISTDGIITMANGAQDPWKNEYHGRYQSNAAVDNFDRGVIIMYSDGANGENGSADGIAGGLVNITTPGENVQGKDDYALATVYTYANGYGEVKSITYGFSNNQSFGDASDVPVTPVGQTPSVVVPIPGDGTGSLPTPNLNGAVANSSSPIAYEWSELKTLAQANLGADELRDTYGIEVGDYKEANGVKYILVDLDGNDYDGFVFMYNSGTSLAMNSTTTNTGGYVSSEMKLSVDDGDDTNNVDLYDKLDPGLKSVLKKVTITCNSGQYNASGTYDNGMSVYTHDCHLFLASVKEVGGSLPGYQYAAEGSVFDYFSAGSSNVRAKFASSDVANISSSWWRLRSAGSNLHEGFYSVTTANGSCGNVNASDLYVVVPVFVIG